ncbi:hypothetical protein BRADI_1g41361v3 [Brachypodium distachyon]|uniref:Uncharacterized protein n=1 Tax=Brachypodium distachyon TaxID=15368 RepID=A0A0Q3H5W4_BRADI|nr:hypothetical protein BRADI_1g41361v3 [Brachypodium distachyon]
MGNTLNINNGGDNGRGGKNGEVELPVEPNYWCLMDLIPAAEVESDGGEGSGGSLPTSCVSSDGSPSRDVVILYECRQCVRFCGVPKKVFPMCMYCKQPNLFRSPCANIEIKKNRDSDQSSSK